jgi:DNA-directed RNA polymerase I, II, and III subunit RPABC5
MIIPIKCFTCGMVLADKYIYYLASVREKKIKKNTNIEKINMDKVLYLTKENQEETPECVVLNELEIKKQCCRRHLLTHVDIE